MTLPKLSFERIIRTADLAGVPIIQGLDFLRKLADGTPHRIIEITRDTGIPKSAVKILMTELSDIVSIHGGDGCAVPPLALPMVRRCLGERDAAVQRSELSLPLAFQELERLERFRPRSNRQIDQFRATPRTSCARAQLLSNLQSLDSRRIAFIGDNDLTSIACAMMGNPSRLVVFDIDEKVFEAIATVNLNVHTPIECVPYDAREPIPKKFAENFDVIVTDPPFTTDGIRLFLSRAAELIKPQSGQVFLSYGFSLRARERGLAVQQAIVKMGWLIYQTWPGFNEYFAAGSIGARSTLYHLLSTPKTKPSIQGYFGGSIYTNQQAGQAEP